MILKYYFVKNKYIFLLSQGVKFVDYKKKESFWENNVFFNI